MLKKEETEVILNKALGLIVHRAQYNFNSKELSIYFDNEKSITFLDCALVYDLGILGTCIGAYSIDAGLGMKMELDKIVDNSEEYSFCSFSRDFKDYNNKNEIRVSFKAIDTNL